MLCFIFRIIYSKFIPPFSFFPRRSCPEKDPETLCTLGTASIHFFSGLECIIYFFLPRTLGKSINLIKSLMLAAIEHEDARSTDVKLGWKGDGIWVSEEVEASEVHVF